VPRKVKGFHGALTRICRIGVRNPLRRADLSCKVNLLRKGVPMSELKDDIVAYETVRADLEASALGKWVVFHDKELIGTFDTFEAAAKDAVSKFGRGPYLIRQIGAAAVTLPASVLYHPVHGKHEMRIR
jgi:hypothetical protein